MSWQQDLINDRFRMPQNCDGSGTPGKVIGPRTEAGTAVMCNYCNGRFRSPDGYTPVHPESRAWPNGKDEYGRQYGQHD